MIDNDDDIKVLQVSDLNKVNINISLPHSASMGTILENLIHNSFLKHNDFLLTLNFYMYLFDSPKEVVLGFWDTGKGFKKYDINEWINGKLEKDSGGKETIGFAYWLLGNVVRHIETRGIDCSFDYCILDKDVTILKKSDLLEEARIRKMTDYLNVELLTENNRRVLHLIRFGKKGY